MTTIGGHDSTGTYDVIARMVAANDARRDLRARTALATMRRYERRLVREAAVIGYVLGYQSGSLDGRSGIGGPADKNNTIPSDADIVVRVIQHCDSTADLYPYIAAACNGTRRRVTRSRLYHPEEPR